MTLSQLWLLRASLETSGKTQFPHHCLWSMHCRTTMKARFGLPPHPALRAETHTLKSLREQWRTSDVTLQRSYVAVGCELWLSPRPALVALPHGAGRSCAFCSSARSITSVQPHPHGTCYFKHFKCGQRNPEISFYPFISNFHSYCLQ